MCTIDKAHIEQFYTDKGGMVWDSELAYLHTQKIKKHLLKRFKNIEYRTGYQGTDEDLNQIPKN
jgi:hypothetical protein